MLLCNTSYYYITRAILDNKQHFCSTCEYIIPVNAKARILFHAKKSRFKYTFVLYQTNNNYNKINSKIDPLQNKT